MTETTETTETIDWTDEAAVAAKFGIGTVADTPAADPAPVAASPAQPEPDPKVDDPEPPRDAKGRFIPLNRHEEILERQRNETAAERSAREAAEARVKELESKQTSAAPTPVDDAKFEAAIEYLPDELKEVMRAERASRLQLETQLTQTQQQRENERQASEAEALRLAHEAALNTVPILKEAYANPIKRAAIDAIADQLRNDPDYLSEPREKRYALVQSKFLEAFPAAAPAATSKTDPKPLPPLTKAPASLSAIPGSSPSADSEAETFLNASPLASVAMFATMTDAQIAAWQAKHFR